MQATLTFRHLYTGIYYQRRDRNMKLTKVLLILLLYSPYEVLRSVIATPLPPELVITTTSSTSWVLREALQSVSPFLSGELQ